MRHLYADKDETLIEHARGLERRRCGHHNLENPLSTLECFASVIDPKNSSTNKHRYVVGTQDIGVRAYLRTIPGVPLIYLKRSVMILEPMASATEDLRQKEERMKFRTGLKARSSSMRATKRKRDGEESQEDDIESKVAVGNGMTLPSAVDGVHAAGTPRHKRKRAPGAPNSLSVMKPKKAKHLEQPRARTLDIGNANSKGIISASTDPPELSCIPVESSKRRRKRRHKIDKENHSPPATAESA